MKSRQINSRCRSTNRFSTPCSLIWLLAFVLPGNVSSAQQNKGPDAGFKQARSPEQELADWEKWNAEERAKMLQALARRKEQQISAAKQFKAFYDFQFSDRISESKIRFETHVVDDAGKNLKPVHYDHGTGLAVADVDGDGLLDIYFVNQVGGNQLWRNLGGGRFENITAAAGVAVAGKVSVSASFADIDNDGDPDLYVTTVRGGNMLFENDGHGHFKDITAASGLGYSGHSSGAVFL